MKTNIELPIMPCNFGFEATFHPNMKLPKNIVSNILSKGCDMQGFWDKLYSYNIFEGLSYEEYINKLIDKEELLFDDNSSSDCEGIYEIESKIISPSDLNKFINDYEKLLKITKKAGLIESSKGDFYPFEGGGHIHINVSDLKYEFKILFFENIVKLFINHPYINWIFGQANDKESFQNYHLRLFRLFESNFKDLTPLTIKKEDYIEYYFQNKFYYDGFRSVGDKNFALNPSRTTSYQTLEMRFFQMPKSVNQLICHLDFVRAIYTYCYFLTKENKSISFNENVKFALSESLSDEKFIYDFDEEIYKKLIEQYYQSISFEDSVKGFISLSKEIKFDDSNVEKLGLYEDNLRVRYELYGKDYLN
jgi:hypothetical protein